MIKVRLTLLLLSVLISPVLARAETKPSDPVQAYREEIQQAEAAASQTLLDQLDTHAAVTDTYANSRPTQTEPLAAPTPSNSEKAFSTAAEAQKNTHAEAKTPSAANPWLKPNPWAQTKVNPWANAPIPGPAPTSPAASTSFTPPNPPNIFAPPHSGNTTDNKPKYTNNIP
jgi:hypothetical protein